MHAAVALAGVDLIGRPMGVKSRAESGLTNASSAFVIFGCADDRILFRRRRILTPRSRSYCQCRDTACGPLDKGTRTYIGGNLYRAYSQVNV
jgi:hypothetical protein